jgi:ABC-type Na+ efflux pump permease subunit
MDKSRPTTAERLRMVSAIAAKDIADAIKNRTVITIVLGMAIMMLSVQALPLLLKLSGTPRVVVYNAANLSDGTSRLITAMTEDGHYHLTEVDSLQALQDALVDSNAEVLGLVVPAGFEQAIEAGQERELAGYVVWSRRSAVDSLAGEMERYLEDRRRGQPGDSHLRKDRLPGHDCCGVDPRAGHDRWLPGALSDL